MRANGDFIEIDCYQRNKHGHLACGDAFLSHKFKAEGRVVSVLSDGLGSGIKASVLSTITSSMLLNFALMNEDIVAAAASVIKTLPEDSVRKIGYATFCICDIDCFGKVKIAEYETPSFYLYRQGHFVELEKQKIPVEREDLKDTYLWTSEFSLQKEDRIIFFSDGVNQSGMGSPSMPFGWGDGVRDFIGNNISKNPEISAKELSHTIVAESGKNDGYLIKDDTSCCVIYMRKPRNLLILTGPPFEEKNDGYVNRVISHFSGKKVICGGTTAQIISRESGKDIHIDLNNFDKTLPPISHMEGIDLITEGILTLSQVERLLSGSEPDSGKGKGPAGMIVKMLANSDKITFIVGTRINTAHQDPNLPVELEIRRNVVKKIKEHLENKYLKDVDINYI